jgi:hypothetical protein
MLYYHITPLAFSELDSDAYYIVTTTRRRRDKYCHVQLPPPYSYETNLHTKRKPVLTQSHGALKYHCGTTLSLSPQDGHSHEQLHFSKIRRVPEWSAESSSGEMLSVPGEPSPALFYYHI